MESAARGFEDGVNGFVHAKTALRMFEDENVCGLRECVTGLQVNVDFRHVTTWCSMAGCTGLGKS